MRLLVSTLRDRRRGDSTASPSLAAEALALALPTGERLRKRLAAPPAAALIRLLAATGTDDVGSGKETATQGAVDVVSAVIANLLRCDRTPVPQGRASLQEPQKQYWRTVWSQGGQGPEWHVRVQRWAFTPHDRGLSHTWPQERVPLAPTPAIGCPQRPRKDFLPHPQYRSGPGAVQGLQAPGWQGSSHLCGQPPPRDLPHTSPHEWGVMKPFSSGRFVLPQKQRYIGA